MSNEPIKASKRVLEPNERISEVLFGLIMVFTFTGSLSVAEADRTEVRTMLIGALGCNIAWGIIDGILCLMGCLSEQGRDIRALRALLGPAGILMALASAGPGDTNACLAAVESAEKGKTGAGGKAEKEKEIADQVKEGVKGIEQGLRDLFKK